MGGRKALGEASILITCEHGGNRIPAKYRNLFADAGSALESHRGYDPGTLELARRFAKSLEAPLFYSTVSRLLIELNRTLGHRQIFSEWSRSLSREERQKLVETLYRPYRSRVEEHVASQAGSGPVLHLSVHSFTPVLNEKTRRTDVGLLFDPSRPRESGFCRRWKRSLQKALPGLSVHLNLPYRGTSDGLTVALRKQFPDSGYSGIELEVNQKFVTGDRAGWKTLQGGLVRSFSDAMARGGRG